ncbi:hypothetical protein N7451_000386 [Penicillium sp. IBT 35674x]|nr:hypothetical protein N7451_000386 [Penicillium sp. IBT 35674x]
MSEIKRTMVETVCHFGKLRGDMMRIMAPHRQHPGPGNSTLKSYWRGSPLGFGCAGDPAELLYSPPNP